MSGETEILVWLLAAFSIVAVLGVFVSALSAVVRHRPPTGNPDSPTPGIVKHERWQDEAWPLMVDGEEGDVADSW